MSLIKTEGTFSQLVSEKSKQIERGPVVNLYNKSPGSYIHGVDLSQFALRQSPLADKENLYLIYIIEVLIEREWCSQFISYYRHG